MQLARDELDRVFGENYAAKHPELVSAVMISAALDWAAITIAAAVVVKEETVAHNGRGSYGRTGCCGRGRNQRRPR